jgi:acyl-CoA thioesterase FadM
MYPLVRLAKVTARAWRCRRLEPLDTSRVSFLVWPNDLDNNLHLNNGRYLTLMDLGRWDLALRTGLVGLVVRNRWQPLAGGVSIRFRRPLPPFRSYHLLTRILAWDSKWFYMEQRFRQGGRDKARALVRVLFRGPGGNVPPEEVAAALGRAGAQSPPLGEELVLWDRMLAAGGAPPEGKAPPPPG